MISDMQKQADEILKAYQEIHKIQRSSDFSIKKYNRALKRFNRALNKQSELIEIAE